MKEINNYQSIKNYVEKISKTSAENNENKTDWRQITRQLTCDMSFILTSLELYYPDAHETITKSMEL